MNKFIQWWLTPKFPKKHIENALSYNPQGLGLKLRNFYRTWLFHPIRRRVAKLYLFLLRKLFGLKVIGITGSAGKTTTKEMIASILKTDGEVVYSFANIDPVYNIPTTILNCNPSTKYLVLEMGIEFPGEMDFYLWLAKPDISVITNINATHVEFMGNIRGVAREKGRIVKALNSKNIAVLNASDKYSKQLALKIKSKKIWYGDGEVVTASNQNLTTDLETRFRLNYGKSNKIVQIPFVGKHFVQNALAASAVAFGLGLDIDNIEIGLRKMEKPAHRMQIINSKKGYLVIDDTYNANPLAVKETLETFKTIKAGGKKIFVFGEMKELGNLAVRSHKEVGRQIAAARDIDYLFCIGSLTKNTIDEAIRKGFSQRRTHLAVSNQELSTEIKKITKEEDCILVKGSRSMKLEEVVKSIE